MFNKSFKITDNRTTYKGFQIPKKVKQLPEIDPFAFSHEDRILLGRIKKLQDEIKEKRRERKELLSQLKNREIMRNEGKLKAVSLYALRLEDNCWYIGMSYNPLKRFIKHKSGKGANWTRLHKPIEIFETRITKEYIQDNVAKLEDDMTIEYMLKYGSAYVRGGGYCQLKPKLPEIVKQNETVY